jgi:integrase/recombinase XerD
MQRAIPACPSLATKHVTPHVIRHTTAMHLLQAGVDMATLALWLGHESIETTHMYLQADLAMKEAALKKLDPLEGGWQRFHADDPLLAFLTSL